MLNETSTYHCRERIQIVTMEDGQVTSISETCVQQLGVSRETVDRGEVYIQDIFENFNEIMKEFDKALASNDEYRHPFKQRFGDEVLSFLLTSRVILYIYIIN